jgi:hypothetical protein
MGHRAATTYVDGYTVAPVASPAVSLIRQPTALLLRMNRNPRETCFKIMKVKEMSDAKVVQDLQPFREEPNVLQSFNLLNT